MKTQDEAKEIALRPMRGFFSMLTPEQRAAVRSYKGPDGVKPIESGNEGARTTPATEDGRAVRRR